MGGNTPTIAQNICHRFSRSVPITLIALDLGARCPYVLVMSAHPEGPSAILVAALWHDIEVVIVDVEQLIAAHVAGIGVKDITALVPVEHAVPLPIGWSGILDGVVEVRLAGGQFCGRESEMKVEIEVGIAA